MKPSRSVPPSPEGEDPAKAKDGRERDKPPLLTRRPVDVGRLLARAASPRAGAVVLFLGAVRNHHEGRRVTRLEYSAYEPMAERTLAVIERETVRKFPVEKIALVHRLGPMVVGEASVAIAVACAHRPDAFAACRHVIERIKEDVPIWKKEFGPRGAVWIEGPGACRAAKGPAARRRGRK